MFRNKKMISLIISTILVLSFTNVSFAMRKGNVPSYFDYVSKLTQKSVEDLKIIEKEYGDLGEYFNITIPANIRNVSVDKPVAQKTDKSVKTNSDATKIPGYYEAYSKYTGLSIAQLKGVEKYHGDLNEHLLPIDIEKLETNRTIFSASDSGGGDNTPMTDEQWTYIKNKADKGDTLVCKDQWSYFINHGHTALVSTSYSRTIEHTGEGLSVLT